MADVVWYARFADGTIGDTLASVLSGTSNNLFAQVSTNNLSAKTHLENVEITEGEMDVEEINTFGNTQRVNEKRPTMFKITCDMVFSDSDYAYAKRFFGPQITATTGYAARYQGGEKATVAANRAKCAFALQDSDGTNIQAFLLNNAYMTGREFKQSAEDYVKISVVLKCLHQDFYEEYK